jgi:hypothetical protein
MIAEFNGGMRPEFIPLQFGVVVDVQRVHGREFCDLETCKSLCIEVFRGINMVLRNGDPVLAAASCRLLLNLAPQQDIARRSDKSVNAEKLPRSGLQLDI